MAKEVKLCTHILLSVIYRTVFFIYSENLAKLGCKCANIMSLSTSSYHGGCRFISQFFRVEGCSNAGPTAPGQSGAPNGEQQCWVHHHAACPGWWGSAHHVHTQLSS
ncbi:unnamed protein product [Sphagnum jensenii]|uniref:Secreted protein n=1 Tax=Sphagnum jensenii TaxID=128206 RepID=A0ABP0W615_9BRYO